MAGYRPRRRTYRLVFDDGDLAGLEVAMRSVSVESMLSMAELADQIQQGVTGAEAASLVAGIESLFARFAKALDSWNIEDDDGQPVPATLEGVKQQDADLIMQIFAAWFEAVSAPNPRSPAASNGGATSPAAQIPMAARSSNRGN